jgi:hypothetical protein
VTDTDTWFLLVQHKRAGRTDVTTFDDPLVAAAAYGEAERRYEDKIRRGGEVDVLLVGASSLDVVKERYPSYFANLKSRARKVQKLLADLPPVLAH